MEGGKKKWSGVRYIPNVYPSVPPCLTISHLTSHNCCIGPCGVVQAQFVMEARVWAVGGSTAVQPPIRVGTEPDHAASLHRWPPGDRVSLPRARTRRHLFVPPLSDLSLGPGA
jgi:hypothetical protein